MAEEGSGVPGHLQHCDLPPAGHASLLQAVPCCCVQTGTVSAAPPFLGVPRADLGAEEAAHLVVPQEGQEG